MKSRIWNEVRHGSLNIELYCFQLWINVMFISFWLILLVVQLVPPQTMLLLKIKLYFPFLYFRWWHQWFLWQILHNITMFLQQQSQIYISMNFSVKIILIPEIKNALHPCVVHCYSRKKNMHFFFVEFIEKVEKRNIFKF